MVLSILDHAGQPNDASYGGPEDEEEEPGGRTAAPAVALAAEDGDGLPPGHEPGPRGAEAAAAPPRLEVPPPLGQEEGILQPAIRHRVRHRIRDIRHRLQEC